MNNLWQSFRKLGARELRLPLLALLLLALFTGYLLNSGSEAPPQNAGESTAAQTWTCSMHPQIQLPQPGACPICGMDLIPVSAGNDQDLGAREIRLSANAVRLAAIRTEPVARSYVSRTIRMSGKIAMDETRLRTISAYVPGRIERMFVDYTGTRVRKGDHLVELYSPGLISAQTELLQAARSLKEMAPDAPEALRRDAGTMLEAVREKMRLLGLTGPQIAAIEKRGAPAERLTIYSPISGIVTRRHASEGTYVQTGSPVYTVADLSHLWVMLDAYESDLEWLRYGQSVDFTVEAYPGETFTGIIAFIDPVLNATTRTVNVRVNVKNAAGRLKPEMLVRATVKSSLSSRGKVMDPALSGKWISPMHPEVVKNGPGSCDVCGMPLVRAEDLGYVAAGQNMAEAPLVIPATAPLITGKRAVVYVSVPGEEGRFEGREVVLGPRSGDFYLVREGLSEGEAVVVNGAFKLDSDLQIRGNPSMMNPDQEQKAKSERRNEGAGPDLAGKEGEAIPEISPLPADIRETVAGILDAYFEIQIALSLDDAAGAATHAATLSGALKTLNAKSLAKEAQTPVDNLRNQLLGSAKEIAESTEIEDSRRHFQPLSDRMYLLAKALASNSDNPVLRYFCPMAFDNKGAYWLQNRRGVENPYFGSAMYRCGEEVEILTGGGEASHEGHNHE